MEQFPQDTFIEKVPEQTPLELSGLDNGGKAVFVPKTLRSGQTVFFEGSVVVMGDVNHGAQIIAGGHVVVMGALRGFVHAGYGGFSDATVTALELHPTQLRIGEHITREPEGEHEPRNTGAEIARIKDGMVVVEKYKVARQLL